MSKCYQKGNINPLVFFKSSFEVFLKVNEENVEAFMLIMTRKVTVNDSATDTILDVFIIESFPERRELFKITHQ